MDTLIEAGISPENRALRRAPANLVNWQMLESAAEGYLFFIPLMQEWTALQRPIDQVKNEELDRLDLAAVSLYEAARQAYDEGYSNRAAAQLQQALTRNPNHGQARLLLGTILGEENQLAEAVFQFEAAYKLDPPAARTVLVAALLQFGDALQEAGNYLEARAAYERVLAISPGEKSVRARLRAIKRRIKEPSQSRNKQDTSHPEKLGQNRRIVTIMIAMSILLLVVICTWFYVPTANEQIPVSTGAAMISATSAEATAVSADPTQIGSAGPATSTRPSEPSPTGSPDQNAAQELSAAMTTEIPIAPATPTQTSTPETQLSGRIVVVGSNSMQPLMEALARGFIDKHANVEIAIEGNSSEAGLEAVQQQTADLGMVSRTLEQDELADLANVQVHQVADPDPIVIIGHILVPVNSLTAQQIIDIYTGTITNWAEISGVDAPIVVVGRTVGADTRSALERTIAGGQLGSATGQGVDFEEITDQAVRDTVSSWPYAIGYVHRSAVEPVADSSLASQSWPAQDIALLEVKVLAFNQVDPTVENVERGTYPLVRPFTLLTTEPPSELVERWLKFISSPEGREIIEVVSRNTAP
jgi:phosphate transport system substrate-binding protein